MASSSSFNEHTDATVNDPRLESRPIHDDARSTGTPGYRPQLLPSSKREIIPSPESSMLTADPSSSFRPHKLLPYQPTSSVSHPLPDIPASSYTHHEHDNRNVPPLLLNGSPAPNKPAAGRQCLPSQLRLESIALSGYSAPTNVSVNNYLDSRLGTPHSPLRNPTDLANHHGLPQYFPKAPSLVPARFNQPPQQDSVSEFFALCQNYSAMLNKAPENADASAASAVDPATVSPQEAAMAVFDVLQGSVIDSTPMDEFLTGTFDDSPLSEMLPTPGRSPMDFGADIFLGTPLTGMIDSFEDFPPAASAFDFNGQNKQQQAMVAHPPLFDNLFTMTPDTSIEPSFLTTPMTPAMQHFPGSGPVYDASSQAPAPSSSRRKSQPTGTRKNVTPETLVPLEAPIQPRKYLTPSSTSRKEVPATFARKRARSQAFGDEPEEAPVVDPSMSEEEQIKAKRLQNTLAARRSRKRKLEHQQLLEDTIEAERSAKEQWRAHAMVLEALLRDKGFSPPPPPQL